MKKRTRFALWWILIFGLMTLPGVMEEASAAVFHVPGDAPSIQAGIDAAADGDTVIVADGIYQGPGNKQVSFHGKAITVRSANGPVKCIVDCEHEGNGFVFESNEGANSILDGFTIMNGQALYGGGIRIEESSPLITNCIFLRNEGKRKGGIDGYGGAVYCSDDIVVDVLLPWTEFGPCRPVITNCIFAGNSADYGGAVYCYSDGPLSHTEPLFVHCTFADNHADLEGGGLYNWMSEPTVKNSIFWKNTAGTLFPEIRNITNSPWITFSDVRGGYPGKGNVDQDPRFIGEEDYHLMSGSPCIDRGIDAGVDRDIDGDARPLLKGFDMGADEFGGHCWDADSDGHPNRDCGGDDCDDANANVYPGNPNPFCDCKDPYPGGTNEISGDGVDNNCNGLVDEWD